MVQHLHAGVARVVADAFGELEHLLLRALQLLAKAHAVEDQQAGDAQAGILHTGTAGDLGDDARGLIGCQGTHVQGFIKAVGGRHRCGAM